MNIPEGATHFHTFYGIVTFYKVGDDYYSREAERWYSCWYNWDRKVWVKDQTVSTRQFRPVTEFNPENYA